MPKEEGEGRGGERGCSRERLVGPTVMVAAAYVMFGGQTRTAGGTQTRARASARRGTATIAVEAAAAEMAKAMAAAAVAKAIPAVAGSGYMYGGGKLAGNVSKENTTIPNAIPKYISINL